MAAEAKERGVPLTLLAVGVVLMFVAAGRGRVMGEALEKIAVETGLQVLLMLVGCVVTAKLIGVSFGAPGAAVLKLAAIVVLPSALGAAINITGVSWALSIIVYLSMLVYLFELDLREALIFTGIMLVIRIATGYLVAIGNA